MMPTALEMRLIQILRRSLIVRNKIALGRGSSFLYAFYLIKLLSLLLLLLYYYYYRLRNHLFSICCSTP